jgi:hypothetical protein
MRVTSRNHLYFLVCATFLGGTQALAQDGSSDRPRPPGEHGPGDGQRPEPRRPPEAAFTACADLKANDVCEVQLKDRTIEGQCVVAREDDKLFCMPDHPHGPPPQGNQLNQLD